MDGAEFALKQAFEEYKKISELYPNGKVKDTTLDRYFDPRAYFYDWIGDRMDNGLENTGEEFVGIDSKKLTEILVNHPNDIWQYIKDYNGIDQYLTKNWRYWDLVKFIAGYERWNPNVPEVYEVQYITPQVLRMFGFPVQRLGIDPNPPGTAGAEWGITLPCHLTNEIKSKWNDQVLIGPGNVFGLYSCKYGLIKDGINEIFLRICSVSGDLVYLMKKS